MGHCDLLTNGNMCYPCVGSVLLQCTAIKTNQHVYVLGFMKRRITCAPPLILMHQTVAVASEMVEWASSRLDDSP
jgi:hypothetical protein